MEKPFQCLLKIYKLFTTIEWNVLLTIDSGLRIKTKRLSENWRPFYCYQITKNGFKN